MPYITGNVLAVASDQKETYRAFTEAVWPVFVDLGCLAMHENWGVDVPEGAETSFPLAVKCRPDETVVFSWVVWPDRATADRAWQAMMEDPRMQALEMPFDGKRMIWGGFEPLVELRA
jgi:uncharacterized protein YbaA (DUF1428 family)